MIVELFEGRIIKPFNKTGLTGKFTLKAPEKKVSDPQRKYYWGVLVKTVSEVTGYTKNETHGKFGWLTRKSDDGKIPRIQSITELSTKEMEDKNEEIRRYFADFGIDLPLPNEVDYNQIEEP